MVRIFVGVTHKAWFDYLAGLGPDEVHLWQPSGSGEFRALKPGDPFRFKLTPTSTPDPSRGAGEPRPGSMKMTSADANGSAAESRHAPRSDSHRSAGRVTPSALHPAHGPLGLRRTEIASRTLAADRVMSALRPTASVSALITANQRHVGRTIATALALTSFEGLRAYAALRLTSSERQGLAWTALGACSPEQAEGIAGSLFEINQPSGAPLDPDDSATKAQLWAEDASHAERLAYGTAMLQRPSADDQARVLRAAKPPAPARARRTGTALRR